MILKPSGKEKSCFSNLVVLWMIPKQLTITMLVTIVTSTTTIINLLTKAVLKQTAFSVPKKFQIMAESHFLLFKAKYFLRLHSKEHNIST